MAQGKPSAMHYEIDLHQMPIVDNLPTSLEEDNQECIICFEDLDSIKSYRQLPCQHFFHQPCIDDWLKRPNPSCPICRRTFEHLRRPCKTSTSHVPVVVNSSWATVSPLPRYLLVVGPSPGAPELTVPAISTEPREPPRQSVRAWCKRKLKVGRVA
ncbi:hypothetical protein ASPACDRAFT_41586 [Aspergillus aculeatus ATCC 16872]|uniref:RING-type domain-containing protein n=1 Tax=Aspergillus aculeatus (strain ATCC 16872 / CBS 172.66 / WB 5094) TaxID=690307 RepID=A0A1L9WZ29_ASPA1|nr:uncharacterized protein ASPACDRAFT_41586 [Aspergillus aculeatus ATCC 16872]OJK01326.1 hypothetical protein ASPACDRAFT_41586 [Aspergillus aculeatus ATCC 16872]